MYNDFSCNCVETINSLSDPDEKLVRPLTFSILVLGVSFFFKDTFRRFVTLRPVITWHKFVISSRSPCNIYSIVVAIWYKLDPSADQKITAAAELKFENVGGD